MVGSPLKLHIPYAYVTWFKRKGLNSGLEVSNSGSEFLSPELRTFLIYFIYFPSLIMGNMKNNVERKKTATPLRVAA